MSDINFYEEALQRMMAKKQSYVERFLADESVKALIKKYVYNNMNERDIVNALNLILKDKQVREKFQIPDDKRVIVYQKDIKDIIIQALEEKMDAKKGRPKATTKQPKPIQSTKQPIQSTTNINNQPKPIQSTTNINQPRPIQTTNSTTNIQGDGKAKPLINRTIEI